MLSQEEFTKLYSDYKEWAKDDTNQIDGYIYEKSFDNFLQNLGKKLFKQSTSSEEGVSERQKKK